MTVTQCMYILYNTVFAEVVEDAICYWICINSVQKQAIYIIIKTETLCQKYPYKARKKCMEKTSRHNDYYHISMLISQENQKNPGRF